MRGMSTTATGFSGSDVHALHALAVRCAEAGQYLAALCARTTAALCTDLVWHGADARAMRTRWQEQEAPAIDAVAAGLREAGLALVREAREQLAASTDGAAGPAGGSDGGAGGGVDGGVGGAHGGAGADLRARLETTRTILGALPQAGMLVRMAREFPADLLPSAANDLRLTNAAYARTLAGSSALERGGLKVLGPAAAALDGWRLYEAWREDDLTGVVQNGTSLGIAGLGLVPAIGASVSGAAGVAWAGGTLVGTAIYDGMQGTSYGDHFEKRAAAGFDKAGAWGMLGTPYYLAAAGWDWLTEAPPEDAGE